MNNIRTFDIIEITDCKGVLGQKGGSSCSGNWYVISEHSTYVVAFRGSRVIRVNSDSVKVVGYYEGDQSTRANAIDDDILDLDSESE